MKNMSIFHIFCLLCIPCLIFAQESATTPPLNTTTTAAEATTTDAPKKIDVLNSKLCKTCTCSSDNKQIDCNGKLSTWLTDEEWAILQNGDIIFETMLLERNNFTKVPQLPTYGVKNLFLGHNQIAEIAISAFQNLTELSKLDLSNNKLNSKALAPDVFKGPYSASDYLPLARLIELNLAYNDLHNLDSDLFEHIPKLETLILTKNTFMLIDHQTEIAIAGLTSLKTLDLSYMELKKLPESLFHGPRDLETLILTGNLFNKVPESLTLAVNLKFLILDENLLTDFNNENIFPLVPQLNYLSIAFMPELTELGPHSLGNLQNLTTLKASDNPKLSQIDALALSKNATDPDYLDYPPLEKLYLNNNNLSYLPRSLIRRWDKVQAIDLRFNPWNCDCTNDWLVNNLIELINNTNPVLTNDVQCAKPDDVVQLSVLKLYVEKSLSCSEPTSSHSTLIWVGLLIGIVVGITLALVAFYFRNRSRNQARRAKYDRATLSEDFHI